MVESITTIDSHYLDILKTDLKSCNIGGGSILPQGHIKMEVKKSNYDKICDFNQKVYTLANDMAKTKIESESEHCTQKEELDNKFKKYWNNDENN